MSLKLEILPSIFKNENHIQVFIILVNFSDINNYKNKTKWRRCASCYPNSILYSDII